MYYCISRLSDIAEDFFPLLFFFNMVIHFPVSIIFLLFLELGRLSENKTKEEEIILEKVALGHPRFPNPS